VRYFSQKYARRPENSESKTFLRSAAEADALALARNVRELQNLVERAVILTRKQHISHSRTRIGKRWRDL